MAVVILRAVKIFPRVTNSLVITAALLAVICSLCFSVGEGLRLTPFPSSTVTQRNDSGPVVDVEGLGSFCKYGPLDVPTQIQKRGKRNAIDLAAGPRSQTKPVFTSIINASPCEADSLNGLLLVAPPPGRAPPLHS